MIYLLIGAVSAAFLAHDWFYDKLSTATKRIKVVYAMLLILSFYHLLIYRGWLRSYSYLDTSILIFGEVVRAILAYFNPKG
jgi:TRAP-type C4-dicarboxylate transport system permease small subunit